ncbi:MAG TPA: Rieske (2Fe-2S) protein, partial [Prolixibacteraceae bacterium]|nr:Rieske (2Fe-2S) protein [Prolixibacteraceae bacterium]
AVISSCSSATTPGTTGNTVVDLNSSQFAALKTVGGFAYNGNVFIMRTSDTNYIAISRICTHQGCTVAYNSSTKQFVCPCHGARYNASGAVLQGPAQRPLTIYTATVLGTTLTIS